jgi:hypothetical protein
MVILPILLQEFVDFSIGKIHELSIVIVVSFGGNITDTFAGICRFFDRKVG